jgi:hypothetical protein
VTTTVWIGVFVVAFFNLRFGWIFSGLVVPGYLTPLLILKPVAAAVVCIEGILAYFCVWFVSEYLSRWGYWCNFFGRDRFFALVLASMAIRLLLDGWLLPELGMILSDRWHWEFDYRSNLHSFGLIIVALLANQFWKPGIGRGVLYVSVHIGLTYLLVRYGLMELTNFNIGRVEYLYEDMATSFLASPKAYIIVITTAFLASRMNLLYGWDFNGILIPSLLTLLWYEPLRILASFVESAVILNAGVWALQTPWLKKTTIEGARKVLLFFNISFVYKLTLGYVTYWFWSDAKVTDIYGFGYLLPTLMAVKAHDKNITIRLTRATVQISLVAAALANILGFGLTLFPTRWGSGASVATTADKSELPLAPGLLDLVQEESIRLRQKRIPDSAVVPLGSELDLFAQGVRKLKAFISTRSEQDLAQARTLLSQVNYRVEDLHSQYLVLRENTPSRGWGLYVLARENHSGVIIEVPAPLDEWGVAEAGTWLFMTLRGGALAIAGAGRRTNADGSADVLTNPRTIYHTFHRIVGRRNVLQIRGIMPAVAGSLRDPQVQTTKSGNEPAGTSLWIPAELPPSLNLALLKTQMHTYRIEWRRSPFTNLQREDTWTAFAELWLDYHDRRTLFLQTKAAQKIILPELQGERIDGYLQSWLLERKGQIAERGTNLYVPPTLEELLFLDDEVLVPLTHLVSAEYQASGWSVTAQVHLQVINAAAGVLGYQLVWYRHQQTQQDYLLLTERDDLLQRRYWGTYVFRLGETAPYVVQVPRPLFERNSFEHGVALFERLKARSLFIAGAHPRANVDGRADVVQPQNKQNFFNLVHQVTLREAGNESLVILQSRAFGPRADQALPTADVLFMTSEGYVGADRMTPLGQQLLQILEKDGLRVQPIEGAPETAGFETGGIPQALYLSQTRNKEFVVLWLSPHARSRYLWQSESRVLEEQFRALGIPSFEADLYSHLAATPAQHDSPVLPDELRRLVGRYVANRDVLALHALRQQWRQFRFERLLDPNSGQTFLLISGARNRFPVVVNLGADGAEATTSVVSESLDAQRIEHFIASRAGWLEFRKMRVEVRS